MIIEFIAGCYLFVGVVIISLVVREELEQTPCDRKRDGSLGYIVLIFTLAALVCIWPLVLYLDNFGDQETR